MDLTKFGKSYLKDLKVKNRFPIIRNGKKDKKYPINDLLDANATVQVVNDAIKDLIDGAPEWLDTLREIVDAIPVMPGEGEDSGIQKAATSASGYGSLALNVDTRADAYGATAIGKSTQANGGASFAGGNGSHANGENSFAFGLENNTNGQTSMALGVGLKTLNDGEVAVGRFNQSSTGITRFTVGGGDDDTTRINLFLVNSDGTIHMWINDTYTNVETFLNNVANSIRVVPGGGSNAMVQKDSNSTATGDGAFATGNQTTASGNFSHTEGDQTIASANNAHAEGYKTQATGNNTHAEGVETVAQGIRSHAEGAYSQSLGQASHAEGTNTKAVGNNTHAEGDQCESHGINAHSEGFHCIATGNNSHAGGYESESVGIRSFTHGTGTKTLYENLVAFGKFNSNPSDIIFAIGNGTDDNHRSNVFEVYKNGEVVIDANMFEYPGSPTSSCNLSGTNFISWLLKCEKGVMSYWHDTSSTGYDEKYYIPIGLCRSGLYTYDIVFIESNSNKLYSGLVFLAQANLSASTLVPSVKTQEKLISGTNIKTINGTTLLGSGDISISGGIDEAYVEVNAGLLDMDAGHTYYEVPASVYTDLDAAWTAKKIPVLTGGLNSHTVGFSVVVAKQQDHFIFFYHGTNATQGGNDYHLFGRITSTGGLLYITEEQPLLVSGTNIKTINNTSLLGSGDIAIPSVVDTSATAPTTGLVAGYTYFDTTDGKPYWYDGTQFVDATGAPKV